MIYNKIGAISLKHFYFGGKRMRKRVIPLILMLILGIVLVFAFSACGDEEKGGDAGDGGNGGDKTPLGLAIVDENGEINQGAYSFGKIEYGSKPNLDSVKIYMGYMDGSNAEISKADLRVSYMKPDGSLYSSEPANFLPGVNAIVYSYDDNTSGVTITFEVVTTATKTPYQVSVDKKTWKYGQTATATVTNEGNALEANDFTDIRLITQAKYNEIKDSNNFVEDLRENSVLLNGAKPGQYYIFAFVNYSANSKLESITIEKADLIISNPDVLTSSPYNYGTGKVGNIKLSDLWFINDHLVEVKTAKGDSVFGTFAWVNPNDEINSTNSGQTRKAKFVPQESERDCYNEATVDVILTINKGFIVTPYGETSVRYDGQTKQIWTGGIYAKDYGIYVNVKRNGTTVSVYDDGNNGSYIDSISAVGKYTYTLELKDKVNYYWVDKDDMGNHSDFEDNNSDVTFDFDILPMLSKVKVENDKALLVDKDGVIKFEITKFITPYVIGTLHAEAISADYSRFVGDIDIVNEGGKDYIVISNISKIGSYPESAGSITIHFTAEGTDNYDDVDCDDTFIIYTDAKDQIKGGTLYEGAKLKVYKGTPVEVFYTEFHQLVTNAGEWQFYVKTGSAEDSYMKMGKTVTMPSGTLDCKFVMYDGTGSEVDVKFQIVCVEPQNPVENGATINVTAGSLGDMEFYKDEKMLEWHFDSSYSEWVLFIMIDGVEKLYFPSNPSHSDAIIAAGTYKCRLKYYGAADILGNPPADITFTMVAE